MSNDVLMLLFQDGLFLIALLTLMVLLIEKISKNSSPVCKWLATIFKLLN